MRPIFLGLFYVTVYFSTIVIFRSTSLKFGSLNRNLYVDIKNGFNLENPITDESAKTCANGDYLI